MRSDSIDCGIRKKHKICSKYHIPSDMLVVHVTLANVSRTLAM